MINLKRYEYSIISPIGQNKALLRESGSVVTLSHN